MPHITFESIDEGLGVITINRPEKRNALDDASVSSLIDILESDELQDLGAVVLRANGKHFCAGVDLGAIGASPAKRTKPQGSRLFTAFRESAPVIVGAVHGFALGLGSGVAMACDIVVATDDSQFGYPAVEHGLVNGVTLVGLQELIGARKAMELLVTGRRVRADEALAIGMVNELVRPDDLDGRSMEIARVIAGHRRLAVQTTKQFFYEARDLSFPAATRAGERVVELVRKANDPERRVPAPSAERKTEA